MYPGQAVSVSPVCDGEEPLSITPVAPASAGATSLTADHRVGPNAIIQTGHALLAHLGEPLTRSIYREAGIADLLDDPPQGMIGAELVRQLCRAIEARVDAVASKPIWEDAGCRTGHYILENRIPSVARLVLNALPAFLSGPVLLKAIVRNSWTFAGQASVCAVPGNPACLEIVENPLPLPGRVWHLAVFRTLFGKLVHQQVSVTWVQIDTGDTGLPHDRFRIIWP